MQCPRINTIIIKSLWSFNQIYVTKIVILCTSLYQKIHCLGNLSNLRKKSTGIHERKSKPNFRNCRNGTEVSKIFYRPKQRRKTKFWTLVYTAVIMFNWLHMRIFNLKICVCYQKLYWKNIFLQSVCVH